MRGFSRLREAVQGTVGVRGCAAFAGDASGSVAAMLALCIIALFGLLGGALDFVQAHRMRSAVHAGIDAGVIAGARAKQTGATDEEALAVAESYLKAAKAKFPFSKPIEFKIINGGTAITGMADLRMTTAFLRVIGIKEVPIQINNAASFGNATNIEMSLMLDITGSMSGKKIDDLKDAVEDLISVVVSDSQVGATSRIALAPFSNAVRLNKKAFREATGKDNSGKGSYKGCVVERMGTAAYTDAAPGINGHTTPLEDVAPSASCKDGNEIFPLTNKKGELKKMVKALAAGGSTAGHLGTAWAWYMLSPNWSALFDSDSQPASYDDLKKTIGNSKMPLLRKIAVLMTDGEYNTQYTATDSNTQARAICAEMKKSGIEIYTVGFDIGTTGTAVETLTGCASQPEYFYNAKDGEDLKKAFRDIALKSSPLRIVQ